MTYQLTPQGDIQIVDSGGTVPVDEENRHYQAYLAWCAAGNTPVQLPPPPVVRTMAPLEFLELFTQEEQVAVAAAAMQNPMVNLWWTKMFGATYVDFADPRLVQGLQALVDVGLLTSERMAEVLA